MQENILKQYGYYDVDAFMKLYWNTKNAKEGNEKKLVNWNKRYGACLSRNVEPSKTIKERIAENKNKVQEDKLQKDTRLICGKSHIEI